MGEPIAKKVTGFGGMIPRIGDELLPESAAFQAFNCRLQSGELRGFHQFKFIEDLRSSELYTDEQTPQIAFAIGDDAASYSWLPFADKDVSLVRGPIINDAYDRYYWTGDGAPKYNTAARILNADDPYLLGVPAPTTAPTVTPAGGTPAASRAYVYTFVSPLGEEGPPSLPVVDTGGEGTWALADIETTIPSIAQRASGTWKVRIYRTVAGEDTSLFFYVGEMNLGTATFNDDVSSDVVVLNSLLESEDWEPPPAELDHLIVHPNGFLVGFSGHDVYMSVPYRPHAWPPEYVLSTEFPIVALGVFGTSIVVATTSNPYILTGIDPLAMSFTKTNSVAPCLSRYGLVSYDFGVVYPVERGLVLVDGTRVANITEKLILGDQWKEQGLPANIVAAARVDQQYIAFYDDNTGFIFSPNNDNAAWSRLDRFTNVGALVLNRLTGELYAVRGGVLYQWDASDSPPVQYRWKSKVFDYPFPVNFGAFRLSVSTEGVILDDTDEDDITDFNAERFANLPLAAIGHHALGKVRVVPLTSMLPQNKDPVAGSALRRVGVALSSAYTRLLVWADDELVFDTLVYLDELVPLIAGFKATRWQFELRSYRRIRSFEFGTSPAALKQA